MPATYSDQFFILDPYSGPAAGTAVNFVNYNYVDNNDNNLIEPGNGDTVNGNTVTRVWVGDTVTINVPGVGNVTYTGVTFYSSGAPAVFTPTDGQILQNGTFVSSTGVTNSTQVAVGDLGPVCFTAGTFIDTIDGPCLIEDLHVGDLIPTRDHGLQPILWIGKQIVNGAEKFAPVRFDKGVIGNKEKLLVSPNHRVLISDWRAEMFFGEDEVLVEAKHLVNGGSIDFERSETVEYYHLLFSSHEIIQASGVPSESYFPGHAINRDEKAVQQEILEIFPDIAIQTKQNCQLARPALRKYEANLLAA